MNRRGASGRIWSAMALALVAVLCASQSAPALPRTDVDPVPVPDPVPGPTPDPTPDPTGSTSGPLDSLPPLPPCPRFEPIGSNPPEVLASQVGADLIKTFKAANPMATVFTVAVLNRTTPDAWVMTVEEVGLPPNFAIVKLDNTMLGWEKAITTVNGNDCNAAGQILHANGGSTSIDWLFTSADTTTLVFSKPVCDFPFCLWTVWQDVAAWDQNGFWELFGGRRVTIKWIRD